jgi:hypothetical protein
MTQPVKKRHLLPEVQGGKQVPEDATKTTRPCQVLLHLSTVPFSLSSIVALLLSLHPKTTHNPFSIAQFSAQFSTQSPLSEASGSTTSS